MNTLRMQTLLRFDVLRGSNTRAAAGVRPEFDGHTCSFPDADAATNPALRRQMIASSQQYEHTPRGRHERMTPVDLEMRAELTIWPSQHPAEAVEGRTFATLREALMAAAQAIEAEDAQTWIIMEDGKILSPRWVRAAIAAGRL